MKKFFICAMTSLCSTFAFAQTGNFIMSDAVFNSDDPQTMTVLMENPSDYTAFQFDLTLPKGISVKDAKLVSIMAGEKFGEDRKLEKNLIDEKSNKYRFLSYDMKNAKFFSGTQLEITVGADTEAEEGEITLSEGLLVDPEGNSVEGSDASDVIIKGVENIKITSAGQAVICRDKNLDFSSVDGVKAYIATGHDKVSGKIWLTRVTDVPAGTAVLLMGNAGEYPVPVASESKAIYENMLVGALTAKTVKQDEGDGMTNYILSTGDKGVGFYLAKESGSSIKAGGGYLPLPTTIAAVGEAGSEVTIAMNKYGMKSYCPSQSLDFSDVSDLKAYTATGYTKSGVIRLTRVKQVPAGTGILLLAPAEKKDYKVKTASLQQCYANMFEGTLEDKTIMQVEDDIVNYYVSVKDDVVGYYLASTTGTKISANGSWLPVPKSMTALASRGMDENVLGMPESLSVTLDEVISLSIFGSGDDETTTIRSIENKPTIDTWYNLNGQRIDTPTRKGLYIKNGKKVIVK